MARGCALATASRRGSSGDHLDLQLGLAGLQSGEGDADLAVQNRVDAAEGKLTHRDGDGRVAVTERRDRAREQLAAGRAVEADDEAVRAGGAGGLERVLSVLEGLAALAQQCLTGVREANGAAVALQQSDPDQVLQAPYLLGQRRLSDVQPLGRAPEVKLFGDGDEVLDETQVESLHSHSLLIRGQSVLDMPASTADDHQLHCPRVAGDAGDPSMLVVRAVRRFSRWR